MLLITSCPTSARPVFSQDGRSICRGEQVGRLAYLCLAPCANIDLPMTQGEDGWDPVLPRFGALNVPEDPDLKA
eukprot:6598427-Lingulodinium_polyedra.AAC.1